MLLINVNCNNLSKSCTFVHLGNQVMKKCINLAVFDTEKLRQIQKTFGNQLTFCTEEKILRDILVLQKAKSKTKMKKFVTFVSFVYIIL